MKIALIGYGKMGQIIEKMATEQGHEVVLIIDKHNVNDLNTQNLQGADVAIEFTRPESAFHNISTCVKAGIPVVSGTTGWLDKKHEIDAMCKEYNSGFFYASNYSIGVNIFFALNRFLAKMMNSQPQYEIDMEEIHHTEKLDAPSGTGITLARDIISQVDKKMGWTNEVTSKEDMIPIISKRIANVKGTHQINYHSTIDRIEIKHIAHSREGFAKGAIQAAQWLIGRVGSFGMEDMLDF